MFIGRSGFELIRILYAIRRCRMGGLNMLTKLRVTYPTVEEVFEYVNRKDAGMDDMFEPEGGYSCMSLYIMGFVNRDLIAVNNKITKEFMGGMEKQIIRLSKAVLSRDFRQKKSIFCSMVLRLMDTEKYANDYCNALDLVLELFPEVDRGKLEKELNKYV